MRKASALGIELQPVPKADFDVNDADFRRFCLEYAEERFKGGEMRLERLAYILKRDTLSHVLIFRSDERVYGYVFVAVSGEMLHYWFAFFDTGVFADPRAWQMADAGNDSMGKSERAAFRVSGNLLP